MIKKERFKNPYFWLGAGAVVLTAMQIEPSTLTSWALVKDAVINFVSNPFMIGTTAIALLGVFTDPTTKGITDKESEGK